MSKYLVSAVRLPQDLTLKKDEEGNTVCLEETTLFHIVSLRLLEGVELTERKQRPPLQAVFFQRLGMDLPDAEVGGWQRGFLGTSSFVVCC